MASMLKDPLLLVLIALLAITLGSYFAGLIPYPFGLLILAGFVAVRLIDKQSMRKDSK